MQVSHEQCVNQFLQKFSSQPIVTKSVGKETHFSAGQKRGLKIVIEDHVCRIQFVKGAVVPKQFRRELDVFAKAVIEKGLFDAIAIDINSKSKRSFATLCPDNWLQGSFRADITLDASGIMHIVKQTKFPFLPANERLEKIREITDSYKAFIQEFSSSGPKSIYDHPPEESMADDCKRKFNGKACETSREAFIELLTTFYRSKGPWKAAFGEPLISADSNSATMKVKVTIMDKDHDETVILYFNKEMRICQIEATLALFGS